MKLPEDIAQLVALKMQYGAKAQTAKVYDLALPVAERCVRVQLTIDTMEWYQRMAGVRP